VNGFEERLVTHGRRQARPPALKDAARRLSEVEARAQLGTWLRPLSGGRRTAARPASNIVVGLATFSDVIPSGLPC
jgi:hypothetical protein